MPRLTAVLVLAALIAAPLALRVTPPPAPAGARTLVVVTPHGEHIRHEFGRAFADWAREHRGVQVVFDWRTPGGTSDIKRFLIDRYQAHFALKHRELADVATAILDPRASQSEDPRERQAREVFLASEVGVGVDLFFGGGVFPYQEFADRGMLVDAGLIQAEPDWFTETVIPQSLSGETIYDPQGRFYGACLGVFGITASPPRLRQLGIADLPTQWSDLGEPAYLGQLTLTDPTKSGAAVAAFERILQQQMAEHPDDLDRGWREGLTLIKRLFGNARSITDSSSKPARDVVRGDCAASMALDFQAKFEAEIAREVGGEDRLVFATPLGGTGASADPIGLLRGAPNRDLAVDFIRFVLSPAGQRLWNYRLGTPGGPERYCLRRLPVRKDVLDAEWKQYAADPDEDPFAVGAAFTYRGEWTGRYYRLIGPLIKAIAMDCRDEVVAAWSAIVVAGGPEAVPEAYAAFSEIPFPYAEADAAQQAALAKSPGNLATLRAWTDGAIAAYARAERLAREGR